MSTLRKMLARQDEQGPFQEAFTAGRAAGAVKAKGKADKLLDGQHSKAAADYFKDQQPTEQQRRGYEAGFRFGWAYYRRSTAKSKSKGKKKTAA